MDNANYKKSEKYALSITAYVSAEFNSVGYMARVIQIDDGMGLEGIIENLSDHE